MAAERRAVVPMDGGQLDRHCRGRRCRATGRPARGHALAGRPRLAEFGSEASAERIVEVGRVVTCHGRISAMDVALLMILRLTNRATAEQVRVDLERAHLQAAATQPSWWQRTRALVRPAARGPARPRNDQLDTSDWIEMELTGER